MSQWIKWTGISKDGLKKEGFIEADSKENAKKILEQQGILVKSLGKKPWRDYFKKKVTTQDLIRFFRQLASLGKANISLAQSLAILSKGQMKEPLKAVTYSLKEDIEQGISFASALKKQKTYFQETICHLVGTGERLGTLPHILEDIAESQEKQQLLKQNIKKALTYPCLVLATTLLVSYGLLIFIIPQFQSLFQNLEAEIPWVTRGLIEGANFFKKFGFLCFSIVSFILLMLYFTYHRNPKLAAFFDKMMLKTPFIGAMLEKTAIARFSNTINLCLSAGLSLIEALKITTKVNRNRCFIKGTQDILEGVANGQSLNRSMRNTGLFPPLVTELVAVGEETGTIDSIFAKIYTIFERSLDETVDKVSYLIEPLILLILALIVGFLVIALYLPLFKLGSAL